MHEHHRLGHPSDERFKWMIEHVPGVKASVRGLELWREVHGPCVGCLADKPRHSKLPSSKPVVCEPGEIIAGDILFLDTEVKKRPALLLIDAGSKCPFFETLKGRTLSDLQAAATSVLCNWVRVGYQPKELRFDRESAILAAKLWFKKNYNLELKPMAAGQKEGLAEVSIRIVKSRARRVKAGILFRFGYRFPWKECYQSYTRGSKTIYGQ